MQGYSLIIGTSAKKRTAHEDYHNCSDLPKIIMDKGVTISSAGFVFGREESGLTNDELKKCDLVTHIPMISEYPSVNLAQSVMIYAYVLSAMTFTCCIHFQINTMKNTVTA